MIKDDLQLPGRDSIPVNDRAAQEGAEINTSCIEAAEDEEISGIYLPETKMEESEESTSEVFKIKNQELLKSQFKNDENHNSGMVKTTIQEFPKSQSNNTELNNTDFIKTDLINPYPSDVIDKMDRYRDAIRKNISYGCFLNGGSCQREELNELVELMVDVMMAPNYIAIRMAGVERPAMVVKECFMKLDYSHIAYVLGCLRTNTSEVRNIKSYLLTSLYNAVLTIDNYYRAEANHDMYGSG